MKTGNTHDYWEKSQVTSVAGTLQLKEEVEALCLLCIMRRVSAVTFFYPFSARPVSSDKLYKLWVQKDIENAVLDGTTQVAQHPLLIPASARASGMSCCVWWLCLTLGD